MTPHHQARSRAATRDPRWPQIAARLALLRANRRSAIRIVDADCGAGALLLHTVRQARRLGFTAIEGRGIDDSPALIGRARAAAGQLADPAIGMTFDVADMVDALGDERDLPPDLVLWHRADDDAAAPVAVDALSRAGALVIGDECAATRETGR